MTTTEELLQRCEESFNKGAATEIHLGYYSHNAGNYVVQLKNSTLTKLVELCRLQNEALKQWVKCCEMSKNIRTEVAVPLKALAAFERFEKGEG